MDSFYHTPLLLYLTSLGPLFSSGWATASSRRKLTVCSLSCIQFLLFSIGSPLPLLGAPRVTRLFWFLQTWKWRIILIQEIDWCPLPYFKGAILYFYWRIIVLQCCIHFCGTTKWICSMYRYLPSLLGLPPSPSSHASRSSQGPKLSSLHHTAASHQLSILPLVTNRQRAIWVIIWGAPKSLQMVTTAMKLKDACSLEEKLWPT